MKKVKISDLPIKHSLNNNSIFVHVSEQDMSYKFDIANFINTEDVIIKYGAVGDGIIDDTDAFIHALEDNDTIYITNKKFKINGNIILKPGKRIIGNGSATIIIDENSENTIFRLSYLNEIYGFKIKQTGNWYGTFFECSSENLQDTDSPKYINLRNKIHDLEVQSSNGTFFLLSASNESENGDQLRVVGMWNSDIYNISIKGFINYFARSYCLNKNKNYEKPWITVSRFHNITCDYAEYGFFGSKDESTIDDISYQSPSFLLKNCYFQAYYGSKNFIFINNADMYSTEIIDSIPYDWSEYATGKIIKIDNRNKIPKIFVSHTPITYEFIDPDNLNADINKFIYTTDKGSNFETKQSFNINYFGSEGGIFRLFKAKINSTNLFTTNFEICTDYNYLPLPVTISFYQNNLTVNTRPCYDNELFDIYWFMENDILDVIIKFNHKMANRYIRTIPPDGGFTRDYFIFLSPVLLDDSYELKNYYHNIINFCAQPVSVKPENYRPRTIYYDDTTENLVYSKNYSEFYKIPIIDFIEFSASGETHEIKFKNKTNKSIPSVQIFAIELVLSNPYVSKTELDTIICNNLEPNKKYRLMLIY